MQDDLDPVNDMNSSPTLEDISPTYLEPLKSFTDVVIANTDVYCFCFFVKFDLHIYP